MIPATFARATVTRLRYPRVTDHGVQRADYSATPERSDIVGCWVEPTESAEVVDGRLAVRTGYTVVLPPATDLVADDHVEFAGVEYDVVGDILHVPSATGALDATKTTIVRWEG